MAFKYDFRRIRTRQALIDVLGIESDEFNAVLAFDPSLFDRDMFTPPDEMHPISLPIFYRHNIPKKNRSRGYRTVWEPFFVANSFKALARRLGSFFRLVNDGYPHDCSYGYRPGRNIRENAKQHAGRKLLLSLDLENFFPSISRERIDKLFQSAGINAEVSGLLSRFVTIGGSLPLGLPTSPEISNAIAFPIDIELQALALQVGATYTRYADDLSFSSTDNLPAFDDIRKCVEANGFRIAEEKTRRSKLGQAHFVTGLSISDPRQPHIPKSKKRRLRQELYFARKFGLEDHLYHGGVNDEDSLQSQINRLDGLIKFVAHHEPALAPSLKTQWGEILGAARRKPSFEPMRQDRPPFRIFIDEAEFNRSGTKILAVGMSVSQHQDLIMIAGQEILDNTRNDLWAAGKIEAIDKKGLHFADATPDLVLDYVKRLASMPFEGYVAFAPYENPTDYESTYIRLLGSLITRRLMAAESQFAHIYCEENSKVARQAIASCIHGAFAELKRRNNRHPKRVAVEFVSKPNLGVSVPDFLLGVLGRFLQSQPAPVGKPEPRDRLMFERIRDKYRLILDVSTRTEYSRRRPIEPWQ